MLKHNLLMGKDNPFASMPPADRNSFRAAIATSPATVLASCSMLFSSCLRLKQLSSPHAGPIRLERVYCMTPDFDRIARRMIDLADRPLPERVDLLQKRCPRILSQIRRDSVRTGPLPFWGRCMNIDEFAGTSIVSPSVLEVLSATAQRRMSLSMPHAGLQHTYGYLFSVIPTPFGMKRDRWIDDGLERSLGLPSQTLEPRPSLGTLLTNATWLAGRIAFRNDDRLLQLQRRLTDRIAPSLHRMTLPTMSLRLLESVVTAARSGVEAEIQLRTDIVRMPRAEGELAVNPYLLVYSVADSRCRHPALVTLFAVSEDFREALATRATQRRRSDIRPRYNASVPGLSSEPRKGVCRLERQR